MYSTHVATLHASGKGTALNEDVEAAYALENVMYPVHVSWVFVCKLLTT